MVVGVGVGIASNSRDAKPAYATIDTENGYAAVTMTGGQNGSKADIKIGNKTVTGVKVGTSSKGGDLTITIPAGSTNLRFYAAAWKGVSGLSLKITKSSGAADASISPETVDLKADAGMTGNPTFTLDGEEKNYRFDLTLSNITSTTVFKFATSTTKRFVMWDAACKSSSGQEDDPIVLANPEPQYDDVTKQVSWTTDDNATKYQIKVDTGSYEDIETSKYDARSLTVGTEHTVTIKAVGDETKYKSSEGSVKFTPTAYETHRKFTVVDKREITEEGDVITDAVASYDQSYYQKNIILAGNDAVLSIKNLSKIVTINKLVLSMKSNKEAGAGSVSVTVDGKETFIAGTSKEAGVPFKQFGDNDAYSETYKNITWDNLSFVAKSSIEIKIEATENSLYIESFNIFFKEEVNNDYVSALSVTPNTWTGYTTSILKVEDFKVSVTTCGAEGSASDYIFLGIGHMNGDEFVARREDFVEGSPIVEDTRLYWKAKYPTTPGGSTYLYTYVTLNVTEDTVSTVNVSGKMEKTSYYSTDRWDSRGIEATAIYASGNTLDISYRGDFTFYSDSAMTNEVATPEALGVGKNQTIYIKVTYGGVSNTVGYSQTVDVSYEHGYLITDPLTADEAIGIGSKFGNGGETEPQYYIRGTVTSVEKNQLDQEGKNKWATFYLEESDEKFAFEAYKIAPNENCTNYEDLKVGAVVLLRCRIKNYLNTTIENGSLGELVSISYSKASLEAIALNKNALYLGVNDQYTLTASALPLGADMGEVEWASSDNKVAKIDKDGVVTAVAQGTATITATSDGFSAKCDVVVGVKATLEYKGSSNVYANAYTDSELTEALSLNNSMFNVSYDKNGATTDMNLNPDGAIRMYATKSSTDGNKFTVSIDDKYSIAFIVISFKEGYSTTAEISKRSAIVEGEDGFYEINSNKFTVFNNNSKASSNTQVRISKIDIFYRDAVAAEKVERLTTQTSLAYNYDVDGEGNFTYSNIVMRFGAKISKDLWNELDTDKHAITGFGVMIADGETIKSDAEFAEAIENSLVTPSTESTNVEDNIAIDYFVPVANMETTIGVEGDNYFWNLRFSVDAANIDKMYSAIAYVKVGDEYVVLNMARESVVTLAKDYIANRGCDATTAGGSLSNLAK